MYVGLLFAPWEAALGRTLIIESPPIASLLKMVVKGHKNKFKSDQKQDERTVVLLCSQKLSVCVPRSRSLSSIYTVFVYLNRTFLEALVVVIFFNENCKSKFLKRAFLKLLSLIIFFSKNY